VNGQEGQLGLGSCGWTKLHAYEIASGPDQFAVFGRPELVERQSEMPWQRIEPVERDLSATRRQV